MPDLLLLKPDFTRSLDVIWKDYGGIFLPRGSWIAIAIIFLIFQKIKSFPENIIAIT